MDFGTIAKLILPLAPAAGSILGGFLPIPGGSLIGEQFGKILMRSFGVSTPAALEQEIKTNPNEVVLAKINAALAQARAEIEGFVEVEKATLAALASTAAQVNQTMRVELLPENRHWYYTGWRPACGWVFAFVALMFGVMLTLATIATIGKSDDPMKSLMDAWPLYGAYFAVLGLVVGVLTGGRSYEKGKAIEASAPSAPAVRR